MMKKMIHPVSVMNKPPEKLPNILMRIIYPKRMMRSIIVATILSPRLASSYSSSIFCVVVIEIKDMYQRCVNKFYFQYSYSLSRYFYSGKHGTINVRIMHDHFDISLFTKILPCKCAKHSF